jgi:AraC-like DNA-binding protein
MKLKYSNSDLSIQQKAKYKEKIFNAMENQRLYANKDLKLEILAQKLAINPKVLSQIINDQFKLNYSDFINSYRIKESQRMLSSKAHADKSILEILLEAGFSSKSSFNIAFKKYTKTTPRKYRLTHLNGFKTDPPS